MAYKEGERVEYRPVGGQSDNVSHTTGTIISVFQEDGVSKYIIRNDNTGKETTYQEMNLVGRV
ncbi:hypothetical protein K488DRAFT_86368 [Vararia minispora EC-137]|uniref:Uncharacterized protein n=1 Tax=Vararia minispora EC-137 TaxID=1314806 RepID=A0ACB8QJN1_9AGAM|nr:hypothetical protein K488DRAFT_86368 [Vararia minispora EC-137]